MWFEKLTGFREETPDQVRQNLRIESNCLVSRVNGKRFQYGTLEIPTLNELRQKALPLTGYHQLLHFSETVANVQTLHTDKANHGALFQVASQFNLLEMVAPHITPEHGIDRYENDHTQGPACAIACGAGTIYRNYFVPLDGQFGQSAKRQIDCLDLLGNTLRNHTSQLWSMQNGYALATEQGLQHITNYFAGLSKWEYEHLKGALKIGLQRHTQVTIGNADSLVTQAYCSALPVAYSHISAPQWERFAKLVLEATYEATFYAALANYAQTGNNRLFLTLVGGGAFGNRTEWIFDAIAQAIDKFKNTPLDVRLVSYPNPNPHLNKLGIKP